MHKAAFLDRDGVINKERGDYTFRKEDFIFNPGVFDAMKLLQEAGYLIIVITNQGGISKSLYTKEELEKLNAFLIEECKKNGINITDIFYCPHHDKIENCLCRKPKSLMIEKAIYKYSIDKKSSFMIGDNERDLIAADNAGIKGVKVESNQGIIAVCKREILSSEF